MVHADDDTDNDTLIFYITEEQTTPCVLKGPRKERMTEMGPGAAGGIRPLVPKDEGKKNFPRKPARYAGPAKKEFVTKVVGLESHTFDVGDV